MMPRSVPAPLSLYDVTSTSPRPVPRRLTVGPVGQPRHRRSRGPPPQLRRPSVPRLHRGPTPITVPGCRPTSTCVAPYGTATMAPRGGESSDRAATPRSATPSGSLPSTTGAKPQRRGNRCARTSPGTGCRTGRSAATEAIAAPVLWSDNKMPRRRSYSPRVRRPSPTAACKRASTASRTSSSSEVPAVVRVHGVTLPHPAALVATHRSACQTLPSRSAEGAVLIVPELRHMGP